MVQNRSLKSFSLSKLSFAGLHSDYWDYWPGSHSCIPIVFKPLDHLDKFMRRFFSSDPLFPVFLIFTALLNPFAPLKAHECPQEVAQPATDLEVRPRAVVPPREIVAYPGNEAPGTIVVSTEERRLYFILPDHQAIRYGIGVGRPGFEWSETTRIAMKREWPSWAPSREMRRRRPDLPHFMPGGLNNPLGARAMYLGRTLYRIHGTNEPQSIGRAVSSGCIRMTNEDVMDLYERVKIGTRVIVSR